MAGSCSRRCSRRHKRLTTCALRTLRHGHALSGAAKTSTRAARALRPAPQSVDRTDRGVVFTTDTIGALFTGSPGVLLRALSVDVRADADVEACDAGGEVDEDDEVEIV